MAEWSGRVTKTQVSDLEPKIAANFPRFIHHDRDRIESCARISPWVAQLTVSFPLLFSALASSYGPPKPRSDA
ncbi:hypothetical protein, partial [Stenotrophomonas maltophilia]|uniref:hypothetical protein n=1 Tax=Stenotrophomonas maltophilia TaxID=40324 RepID=UPI0019531307